MIAVTVRPTVDGRWMVLVNGYQYGGDVDASGAGNATYAYEIDAYRERRVILRAIEAATAESPTFA